MTPRLRFASPGSCVRAPDRRRRRVAAPALALTAGCLGAAASAPEAAKAHGLVGRSDLPIPEWLFGWGAAVILIASFVALAVLWPQPRLERGGWRPLPLGLGRVLTSRPLEIATGAIGVLLLALVVWSGFAGSEIPTANFAPTFVYIGFWVGLALISVVLGDVFRAFNPWRAIGRSVGWVAGRIVRGRLPAPLEYPPWLGRFPAAAGIFLFAWMELVADSGDSPRSVALATLIYSAATFLGMALYGVGTWIDRAEAFSVYFNLFSRISPFERRGPEVGLRPPLSGLAALEPLPGTVVLLAVMIGSVSFDGATSGALWQSIAPDIQSVVDGIGLGPARTLELTFGLGLIVSIALAYGFYRLGLAGARSVGGGLTSRRLATAFVHSLVPIALVYAAAHYVSAVVFEGQRLVTLASDPLGEGHDLFGTASTAVDYGVVGATTFWYVQVAFVVLGHVAGLVLAHDRALVLYDRAKLAVRSQYWLLAVMVGYTSLALWLLSEANK